MLGGSGIRKLFSLKMLDAVGIKKPFNLDGADMKKLFSLKMLDDAGVKNPL